MDDAEWGEFMVEYLGSFRGERPMPPERLMALQHHFKGTRLDDAQRIIRRLVLEGQVFDPTPGELFGGMKLVSGGGGRFQAMLEGMTFEEWIEHRQRMLEARDRPELPRGES